MGTYVKFVECGNGIPYNVPCSLCIRPCVARAAIEGDGLVHGLMVSYGKDESIVNVIVNESVVITSIGYLIMDYEKEEEVRIETRAW